MKKKILVLFSFVCILVCGICCDCQTLGFANASTGYKSKILIDSASGKVLDEYNADDKLPIASIVKLMTLYLTFEAIDNGYISFEDEMQVSEHSASMGGSQLFLDTNTSHKVKDLIKSIVIASANDSAVVLAENIAGSENNFVEKMNEKAKILNLNSTHYVDCTGLNEEGYSTARDVATLSRLVLCNPYYLEYSGIWLDSYTHPSGRATELANTNKLLRHYNFCIAGKTGTTEKAGYCYTTLCDNNGFKLIAVVLGADSTTERFEIAKSLVQTGYANYKFELIHHKDDLYKEVAINGAKQKTVKLYLNQDVGFIKSKSDTSAYREEVKLFVENFPIKPNDIVGQLTITNESGEIMAVTDLIVKETIEKAGFWDNVELIIENW